MKKIFSILVFTIAGINLLFAQCLPNGDYQFDVNTGVNMTPFMSPAFISSLNISGQNATIVAVSGGVFVAYEDITGVPATTLAVWGDDTSTDDRDGAISGADVDLYLVTDDSLYSISSPDLPLTYITNGIPVLASPATTDALEVCFLGCGDPDALNFDGSITNGSCGYPLLGCTDETALNYNADATDNDGSCNYDILGCTDSNANNYISDATADDGSCTYDVSGCTDNTANNFNADATVDDGSCSFVSPISYPINAGWNMAGYTGGQISGVNDALTSALPNGTNLEATFDVIKKVTGAFWTPTFNQFNQFIPGEGYMIKVKTGQGTTASFNQP